MTIDGSCSENPEQDRKSPDLPVAGFVQEPPHRQGSRTDDGGIPQCLTVASRALCASFRQKALLFERGLS